MYRIRRGLDIKMTGSARQMLEQHTPPTYYVCPPDFRWLKPKLLVNEGDSVEIGTPLFCRKEDERIVVVAPVEGTVRTIVRGEKRAIEAIIIDRKDNSETSRPVDISETNDVNSLKQMLLANGLWPFLRQRPFSVIPCPDSQPKALFISCFDSSPLAPDYKILLKGKKDEWEKGICILKQVIGPSPIHLCLRKGDDNTFFESTENVDIQYFKGPHPAGNVGTQIHRIAPIDKGETVWYIHPQDVVTIGRFFLRKELSFEKTIALTGPKMEQPGYISTIYGADLSEILKNNNVVSHFSRRHRRHDATLRAENIRYIAGNVLTGKQMTEFNATHFYDSQVTAIAEGGEREIIGWLLPGLRKWSFSHTYLSWLYPSQFTPKENNSNFLIYNTSLNGGRRTFMMTDVYDKVFPFSIIPLSLLKACLTQDIEQMEELGIYEVDDEDFALCEVVCPSKMECQQIIRDGLFLLYHNA